MTSTTRNRDNWPISAALLQFGNAHDATASAWAETFTEVADAGFDHVDLTDSWVRPGDLTPARLAELASAAAATEVGLPAVSTARCSVIDPAGGERNLAYLHRTVEAAATLGAEVVSVGLHRPLTPAQQRELWFWTIDGPKDPVGDPEVWDLAVKRFAELGKHADEVGVLLSLELYEDTYLGTAESAVRLVEDIGLDNVGLNPDIGNLVRLHRPIEAWQELIATTMPYTNYWHVKNYFRDEDPATGQVVTIPAPLELGFVNYRSAVKTALGHGFNGVLCCEHYGGDGLSVSARNRDYLRTLLPAATGGAA